MVLSAAKKWMEEKWGSGGILNPDGAQHRSRCGVIDICVRLYSVSEFLSGTEPE
jgi:hypothetical protein